MAHRVQVSRERWSLAEALTFFFAGACAWLAMSASGCGAMGQEQALGAFEKLGGELCVSGDTWQTCLKKCRAACEKPESSSSSSSQGGTH